MKSFLESIKVISLPKKKALSGVSILLVEDEVRISRMYVRFLAHEGARVRVAFDGVQGLEMLSKEKFDIIVLDLMMPRMNGYDMLKTARDSKMVGDIPVVILTNLKDRPEDVEKIQELGVSDYLIKSDTHLHKLLHKIEKYAKRALRSGV
ncbi:MAG: response regulator [Candidatus Pacebacteria bacterium]|nr:response regulator [Candidatus Paceibacterota bacterium]